MVRQYLPTYWAAVEAEQLANGLPEAGVPSIDDAAYHQFAWNDRALNFPVGVLIVPTGKPEMSLGPTGVRAYTVDVGVYLSGTSNDALATRRLLRAAKALEQIFFDKWGKLSGVVREKLETVEPIDFKLNVDSSDDNKIAGVTLSVTLG